VVRAVEGDGGFVGVAAEACVDRPFVDLARRLGEVNGDRVRTVKDRVVDGGAHRQVIFRGPDGWATYLQVFAFPDGDKDRFAGSVMLAAWTDQLPAWAPGHR
jgi:hypothetical protein